MSSSFPDPRDDGNSGQVYGQDEDDPDHLLSAAAQRRLLPGQIHRRVPVHRYLPLSPFRLDAVLPARQAPKAALTGAAVG